MKIQCQDHPVEHILTSNYFEIPRFQRPYSWEKENWEDFWNDALSTKKDDYFIGSVVTYAKGQSKAIVDGQQRLTTITIILSAIRNSYRKFGYEDRATGTQLFIERNNKNNEATFVLKTETSYPYLQTGIQSFQPQKQKIKLGEEESLLQGAFQYFTTCIDEETSKIQALSGISETTRRSKIKSKLDELRDTVLSLKLIYVELDNEDDAYQVFETLNTRGKDLATTDLLKNHLARLLREKNPLNDDVKVRWSFMTDNIKSISAEGIDLDGFCTIIGYQTEILHKRKIFSRLLKKMSKTRLQQKNYLMTFKPIQKFIEISTDPVLENGAMTSLR